MLNQRLLRNLDMVVVIDVILLILTSLMIIGSATHINDAGSDRFWYVQRQGMFALLNVGVVILLLNMDYKNLSRYATPLYWINLAMLLAVMFLGTSALGAQRWIQIGFLTIQPSEFSKIIMIICLASILEKKMGHLNTFKEILPVFAYVGIPFVLVLKQPDLGTSLVFIAILLGMIFIAGVSLRHLGAILGAGIAALPVFWHFLKDYQKMRLTVFMDPSVDPLGSGYHIIQSKIAIGSGMLWGKGLFAGSQSQLNFLPENHTDFIFAVIGEELGFIGATLILLLYFILMYRAVRIASEARDNFGMLLGAGITSMITFHILVNVGMTAGIMPVTGIPLPFMSYGVSSLTTNMIAVAMLLNIYMRRQKILF